jgi:hypothetical protein
MFVRFCHVMVRFFSSRSLIFASRSSGTARHRAVNSTVTESRSSSPNRAIRLEIDPDAPDDEDDAEDDGDDEDDEDLGDIDE